jgi:hypothetical protein
LFPTSSLGTSYRVMGWPGWTAAAIGPYVAITGTQSNTQVTVTLSASAALTAGGVVSGALSAGQTFSFTIGAGDIALLQAPDSADLSGTTIDATKPIQVLSGQSCQQVPEGTNACDHLEESLLPVTAYGKHYLVPVPQGPKGDQPGHALRFFGLQDNTTLSYSGTTPTGAPMALSAGQTAYLSSVTDAFEVTGDKPFGIVSYLLGGELLDPSSTPPNQLGDPSSRTLVPVEQFRKTYAVSLPPGYASSHIEIVMPMSAKLQLDGAPVTQSPTSIGGGSFGVLRIPESSASFVSHSISGDQPFGVQLLGYDSYTSHAEPGGMNVGPI